MSRTLPFRCSAVPARRRRATAPPASPSRLLSLIPIVFVWGCAAARIASAQAIRSDGYVADGIVRTVVRDGDRIYIGGDFTRIGLPYGGAVASDAVTGELVGFPNVCGNVYTIVPDGIGGWYLGGAFVFVDGAPRVNLAHLEADHTVSDWIPAVPNWVTSILVADQRIYFVTWAPGGNSDLYVADRTTAEVRLLKKSANGRILSLALAGNRLYVGGEFIYLQDDQGYVERRDDR